MDHVLRCLTATWHAVKQHACAGHKGTSLVGFGKGTASQADFSVRSDEVCVSDVLVVESHRFTYHVHILLAQEVRRLEVCRDLSAER